MTAAEQTPYVIEDQTKEPWLKTKTGKLTAAIVGGVIVLGATFAGGVAVGSALGPQIGHELGIHAPFDRDGDHNFPGGDCQRPPRPGEDGDHGQFNPNQTPAPQSSTQNG